jgi:hypothetical protein
VIDDPVVAAAIAMTHEPRRRTEYVGNIAMKRSRPE